MIDQQTASTTGSHARDAVGIVVIGRNEGARLLRCLGSIRGLGALIAYVDSGSTDGSQQAARDRGAIVVDLDRDLPFTAARARNAGFAALTQARPELELVQFVDGDCEVASGWLDRAVAALRADPGLAVVCGRRREVDPGASVYNRLCDMEWDTPIGPADACGGDAMMRVEALRQVGGFDPGLIAGEEPELCLRLRRRGWRIERLDAEMTRHDAAMGRFGQWWRRSVRAGYAAAEGLAMYGRGYPRFRGALSAPLWAVGLPVVAATAAVVLGATSGPAWLAPLGLLACYVVLVLRIVRSRGAHGDGPAAAVTYAWFCVLAKWAETQGMVVYAWRSVRGSERKLIEYKG